MTTRIEWLRRLAAINELNAHGPAETWSAIFQELDNAGFFASIDAFEANPNKSEADKRRDVIRDAVNFELEQGPKFTTANWAEAKDRTLEGLLSAHIDSLVDCYWDERPTGQALFDLVEAVRIGSDILGIDYVSQLHDPTAPLAPPVDERDEGMDIGSDREPDKDPADEATS